MIDEAICTIKAGRGGDGHVSFRRELNLAKGGPDGGDGGSGGNVYLEADPNINTLLDFTTRKIISARNGNPGEKNKRHGKNGEDIVLKTPVGTLIYDTDNSSVIVDLDAPGKKFLLARGGKGGRGNWYFRSAIHQVPKEYEPGQPGEQKNIRMELKLLAHVGLTGFPNAGKSTILSILTKARPKIADYPFTTLSPNLGIMKTEKGDGLVLADIPGLIEGASVGKGLGIRFLKHIERCRILVYVLYPEERFLELPPSQLTAKIYHQKKAIEKEMKKFKKELIKLPNLTVINKKDLLNESQISGIDKFFKQKKIKIIFISAATTENIEKLKYRINEVYNKTA